VVVPVFPIHDVFALHVTLEERLFADQRVIAQELRVLRCAPHVFGELGERFLAVRPTVPEEHDLTFGRLELSDRLENLCDGHLILDVVLDDQDGLESVVVRVVVAHEEGQTHAQFGHLFVQVFVQGVKRLREVSVVVRRQVVRFDRVQQFVLLTERLQLFARVVHSRGHADAVNHVDLVRGVVTDGFEFVFESSIDAFGGVRAGVRQGYDRGCTRVPRRVPQFDEFSRVTDRVAHLLWIPIFAHGIVVGIFLRAVDREIRRFVQLHARDVRDEVVTIVSDDSSVFFVGGLVVFVGEFLDGLFHPRLHERVTFRGLDEEIFETDHAFLTESIGTETEKSIREPVEWSITEHTRVDPHTPVLVQ